MTKQISNHAAAAKAIRAELKAHGIKGTVRASSYSMGSSVRVHVTDLLPATVDAIRAFASDYQYGSFDGMTDCYNVDNSHDELPQVKFVFVECSYSDELRAAARAYADQSESNDDFELQQRTHQVLNGTWGEFWASRKPRVRVA